MTTIATDGRSMAGDGLECQSNTITGRSAIKVHRLTDGRVVGAAGEFAECLSFRQWLEGGAEPKIKGDMQALVLCADGRVDWYDKKLVAIPSEAPAAVGSGMDFALAAMDTGASPEAAVRAAAARDTCSGGTITVLHLEPALAAVEAA